MKSRTSYFSSAVLRKDITRFAPVWGLYSVFLLLRLLLQHGSKWMVYNNVVRAFDGTWVILSFLYAGICAVMLFGDLYHSRMCNALHALPLRREGWLLTHATAGVLFSAVPNFVYACLLIPQLDRHLYLPLAWFAMMTLQYLFFFGAATLCALCTGQRFAMLAVYTLLNFLAPLIYFLVNTLYAPLLYGIELRAAPFEFFCPTAYLSGRQYFTWSADSGPTSSPYLGLGGAVWPVWGYTLGFAGVGLLLLLLGVLLYRRRALESAGDFIAFRPLAPVFLTLYTLTVTCVFALLAEDVLLGCILLLTGALVGYFTGQMLLHRSVRVFQPKIALGLFILLAALGVSMGLTWLDPLNLARSQPKAEHVQSVQVKLYESQEVPALTDVEDISAVLAMHKEILEERSRSSFSGSYRVTLTYELQSGRTIRRSYSIGRDSEAAEALANVFSRWQFLFPGAADEDWETLVSRVRFIKSDTRVYTEEVPALMAAIRAECDAGRFAQFWQLWGDDYKPVNHLTVCYVDRNGREAEAELDIFAENGELLAALKQAALDKKP